MLTFFLLVAIIVLAIRGEAWARWFLLVLAGSAFLVVLLLRWLWFYLTGAM